MTDAIRKIARELLENGKVDVVIGYGEGTLPNHTTPVFITSAADTNQLVWNEFCLNNLAVYLRHASLKKYARKAIIAKPCDIRNIVASIQENQLARENIHIIGIACDGMKDFDTAAPLDKCGWCTSHNPAFCDTQIGESSIKDAAPEAEFADIEKFEQMTDEERWAFWTKAFEKCVRCYACRAVCPMCYCERCIVEKTMPQWISSGAHEKGNLSWGLFRAMHTAGRCVGCGECERVCPAGIPLTLLYRKMRREVLDAYEYTPGCNCEEKPPMCNFRQEDKENFIR